MIITLKNANFSQSNIGTLSSWRITRSLGVGATYDGPTSVDKDAAFSATVTIAEGYEIGSAGVTVTMGGVGQTYTIVGNVITITIASVTGNVLIKVPTVNTSTGEEEDDDIVYYTITYKYLSTDGTTIKAVTTEQVAAGTVKTFTASSAPNISGYTFSSVSLESITINSNTVVTYTYTANTVGGDVSTVTVDGSSVAAGDFALVATSDAAIYVNKFTPLLDGDSGSIKWEYGTLASSLYDTANNDKVTFTKEKEGSLSLGGSVENFLLDATHVMIFRNNSATIKLKYNSNSKDSPFRLQAMNVSNLTKSDTFMRQYTYGGTYEYIIVSE